MQTLTINLPETVYRQVQRQSHDSQRSVAEEVVAVIVQALPGEEAVSPELEEELDAMDLFSDEELWQAARAQVNPASGNEMQQLLEKQQREGLTPFEQSAVQRLAHYHERVMLVRAKAAVLLKRRGEDISSLGPQAPQ